MFTPEQVEAMLNMGDMTEAEKTQAKQQAFADQLRTGGMGMGTNRRMDTASQLSRAIQGFSGARATQKVDAASQKSSVDRIALLRKLFGSNQAAAPAMPEASNLYP